MKSCIILNGKINDYKFIKSIIKNENYDYIICADGGANHAYEMEIIPDFIIGDLDSAKENIVDYYRNHNVKFEKFPSKKDETDTELCIYLAKKLKCSEIHIIGALGGRIDHTLANINLLHNIRNFDIKCKLISEKEEILIAIDEEIQVEGKVGDIISIIPINGDANGITLENLEYPLNNYDMKFGVPLGISNVMIDTECTIKVEKGSLLIIRNI